MKASKIILFVLISFGIFLVTRSVTYSPSFTAQIIDLKGGGLADSFVLYHYEGRSGFIADSVSYRRNPGLLKADDKGFFTIPALLSVHWPFFQTGLTSYIDAAYSPQAHCHASEKDFKRHWDDETKSIHKIVLADNTSNEDGWGLSLQVLLSEFEWKMMEDMFHVTANLEKPINVSEDARKQFFAMLRTEYENFTKRYPKSRKLDTPSHWNREIPKWENEFQARCNHL